jgi:hypothetical protein
VGPGDPIRVVYCPLLALESGHLRISRGRGVSEEVEGSKWLGGCRTRVDTIFEGWAVGSARPEPMRLIAWNYRGLGNGPAVRGLLDVQKKEDPNVLFLSETKHDRQWMEGLRWRLNMSNMVVKDSVGASGGLALF